MKVYHRFGPKCNNSLTLAKFYKVDTVIKALPQVRLTYKQIYDQIGIKANNWDSQLAKYMFKVLADRCDVQVNEKEENRDIVEADPFTVIREIRSECYVRVSLQVKPDPYKSLVTYSFLTIPNVRNIGIKISLFSTDELQENNCFVSVYLQNNSQLELQEDIVIFSKYFKILGFKVLGSCLGIMTNNSANPQTRKIRFGFKKPGKKDEKCQIMLSEWRQVPFEKLMVWDQKARINRKLVIFNSST